MIRRLALVCIDLVLVGLLAACGLAGFGAWRLSQGPVPLGFAKPYFDQALARVAAPHGVRTRDVVLTWGSWRRPLEIRVIELGVDGARGGALATVPEIAVGLALRPLLDGEIRPTRLDLIGLEATLAREEDGTATLGLSAPDGPIVPLKLADLTDPREGAGVWTDLREVGIHRARLRVEDRRLGLTWTADRAAAAVVRDDGGLRATFAFEARLGRASVSVDGTLDRDGASGTIDVLADLDGARPDLFARELAAAVPAMEHLRGLAVPVGGTLGARLDPRGALEAFRFALAGDAGTAAHPALGRHDFKLAAFDAAGSFEAAAGLLNLDRMEIDLGGPRLALTGRIGGIGGEVLASGSASLGGMGLEALSRWWPADVARGARAWITENLDRGGIEDLNADFAVRFPASGAAPELVRAKVTLALTDARVHYLRPLEPVVGIDASVEIGLDRVEIAIERGVLRDLEVRTGAVAITGLSSGDARISVDAALHGPLRSALEILDHPRFGYAGRLGLSPARVSGRAMTRIAARFPAIAALAFEDVEIGADTRLEAISISEAFPGHDLAGGLFSASIDGGGMRISGKARISGIAADIDWTERFDGLGPFRGRYDVRARLNEADRARLGVDLAPVVTGPVDLAASYTIAPDGTRSASGRLDLSSGTLEIAPFGWRKPPGRGAEATFTLAYEGDRLRSVRLDRVAAADMKAFGTVTMTDDGDIAAIDVARLEIGERIDLGGRIARDGPAGWKIEAAGRRFDAAALVRRATESSAEALPPVRVSAALDRLDVRPGGHLVSARVELRRDRDGWRTILIKGRFPNAKPIEIDYAAGPAGRRLRIDSLDAGRTFKLFGILDRIRGGSLSLNAERSIRPPRASWRGRLLVKGFVLADTPALAAALGVASLGTLRKSLDGDGLVFRRLDLPFRYDGARLHIRNGRALGRQFGMTGHGTIDLEDEEIDVRGTLVPAYTINAALGNIPGVGVLFSPEKGGGLFAATFSAVGPLDRPAVGFNPLAALAPGVLRGLLEGIGRIAGGAANGAASPDAPPPR